MSDENSPFPDAPPPAKSAVSEAVLTEAVRQVDIVHTSLMGLTAIVITLLVAVALPVFGLAPVTDLFAFACIVLASVMGIGVLYVMNYHVHQNVTNQARLTEVLVNSLGQGFLVFGRDGVCGNVYSQACLDLLETVPAKKHITDVLRVSQEMRGDFEDWFTILFQPEHALGFDDVVKFLPSFFSHSQQRRVSLVYRLIHNKAGALTSVVVIATDQTEEYAAQQAAQKQQDYAAMICSIFKERNQFHATLAHVREFLDLADGPDVGRKDAPELLRRLHTLKATVRQFHLIELAQVIHEVESELRSPTIADDETFCTHLGPARQRVADALAGVNEEVVALMGEEHEWRGNVREIEESALYNFAREMQASHVDPLLIRRYLTTVAAVPIRDCFRSFERSLQELAGIMEKQIKPVRFTGGNPRVLTQPLQEFFFSLTHICRNIIDHGIEPPVTRMARGKEAAGQVTVFTDLESAGGDEQTLHIIISDDGNGIDPTRIRAKLATLEPEGDWQQEDDQAVIQRIFTWGMTTSEQVTTLSGRGVGMEAVEREVKLLGGTIRVSSELYKGARFDIRIPYSLTIG